jgi:hypothetical protein
MKALCPVIVVRSSVQNPATIPCDKRLFQGLSTASPVRAQSGRNRFHCRRTKNGWATPNRFCPLLDGRMAGRRSGRNGCFGASAAGVLHGARTIPTVAGRSMRALSRLADVSGFWTLDRTTITGRSAVILRQHTTPFRPMIVPFDDLELSSKLEKLEPSHTRKFPRVNAQNSKLGPVQPWDVKDFLRSDRGRCGHNGLVRTSGFNDTITAVAKELDDGHADQDVCGVNWPTKPRGHRGSQRDCAVK